MIDGQHKFSASQRIRRKLEQQNRPVPKWCRSFRCRVLKPGLELDIVQKIAGREQAKSETVASMPFSATMAWFMREMQQVKGAAERAGEAPVINKSQLLRTTYEKTGKTLKFDGTEVCTPLILLHAASHCLCLL